MKINILVAGLAVMMVGCQQNANTEAAPAANKAVTRAQPVTPPAVPQGGSDNTIHQYTPTNVGGVTPVQGGEGVGNSLGGSAAGDILKDRARHLPGSSQGPAPTAPPADGGDN